MKKHLYFFISSIVIILLCIYSIATANQIVKGTLESVKMLPEALQERVINLYSNNGNAYIYFMAGIGILISSLMITFILRKNVTKKKFIILSILGILFAPIDLITLISILNLVLCITIKNDIITKTEIPKLEYKVDKKYIINSIILILAYLSQYLLKFLPGDKTILSIVFEIILLFLAIVLFYDLLKQEFIIFKNNFKAYISYIIPKLGIGYIIYIAVSLIVTNITKQATSVNQQALEQQNMIYLALVAIIWAPVVEEALFRRCLRFYIKNNNILFIIVSGIIFGLLHTIHEETLLNVILVGLPYMVLGGYLAYIYTKTNNMLSNMLSHAIINTFALIVMIFL